MPTYDYQCDGCGHEFELFQSISEPVKKKCPECKKNKLRRLFGTGAAIMFKGSGFYETDYRSESYKRGAEKAKNAKEGSDAKKSDSGKSSDAASSGPKKTDSGGTSANSTSSKSTE